MSARFSYRTRSRQNWFSQAKVRSTTHRHRPSPLPCSVLRFARKGMMPLEMASNFIEKSGRDKRDSSMWISNWREEVVGTPGPRVQDGEDLGDGQGDSMSKTLYMVIENFKNGDAVPVYRRFRDWGRLAPTGLSYVSSWVSDNLDRCYQLMEPEDRALLDQWIENTTDIVDFDVHAVIS